MAKVVLIDVAGWQGGVEKGLPYPNIGIAYLVSALKENGHDAAVLDMNNQVISDAQIAAYLGKCDITLVGLSVKTATMESARQIGRRIKANYPAIPIIVGGPHATVAAPSVVSEPWVDYVFLGEGEVVLPDLCTRLDKGLPVAGLDGVLVCAGGNPDLVAVARVKELDTLAYPDYLGFGAAVHEALRRSYPLVTSRGCPYKCTYCSVSRISGDRVRTRSAAHVVAELSWARNRYGATAFEVVDDSFNVDMDRAKAICRLLIEQRLEMSWSCPNGIRADRIDAELAALMSESGCNSVMVGVETADPELLSSIKKGESLEAIERGIALLKEGGLGVGGFFIIGLPGDCFRAQEQSVEFARRTGISAHFNMLVPYPGTEVYDWVCKNARLLGSVESGIHFADSSEKVVPVFDTEDFPSHERCRAYEMVHTRLGRFDMIIPREVSGKRLLLEKLRLLWKHDRTRLLSSLLRRLTG